MKISKSEANYIKEQIDNIDNSIRFYNKSSHRLFMGTVISELFILALFIFFVCSGVYTYEAFSGFATILSVIFGFLLSFGISSPFNMSLKQERMKIKLFQERCNMVSKLKCYGYKWLVDKYELDIKDIKSIIKKKLHR